MASVAVLAAERGAAGAWGRGVSARVTELLPTLRGRDEIQALPTMSPAPSTPGGSR